MSEYCMSAGIIGVIAVPRNIGDQIYADLSNRLQDEFRFYDESDHDLGGEYTNKGKSLIDDIADVLMGQAGMPVLFRREWLDYWNAGYNQGMTFRNLGIVYEQFLGVRHQLALTCKHIDVEDLRVKVQNFCRRKVPDVDKWLYVALLEAAQAYEMVVQDVTLVLFGRVLDGCLDDNDIAASKQMRWTGTGFE